MPDEEPVTQPFENVYADRARADAYAKLEFPGTYFLAFRDLPGLLREHVRGLTALDFGCGTGRSTRFLRDLGYQPVGVDSAEQMLARARESDPHGEYRLVSEDGISAHGTGWAGRTAPRRARSCIVRAVCVSFRT